MVWKTIPFAPKYEASTDGQIRNILTKRIRIPFKSGKGYLRISLRLENSRKTTTVHRVIAQTFIENPENKPCVRYIDNDNTNNNVENLEWATVTEVNRLKSKQVHKEHYSNSSRKVWKCDSNTGERIEMFESLKIAALSVTPKKDGKTKICAVCRKVIHDGYVRKTAYGFKWEYDVEPDIDGEEWRDIDPNNIKGVSGYKISSEGRIKNHKGRIGLPFGKKGTYPYLAVHPYQFQAHRLVALTFLENENEDKTVNHIDGNKNNPRLSNLEWVTPSENSQHAVDTGLYKTKKRVRQYELDGTFVKEFSSVKEARISMNVKSLHVDSISHGYKWVVDNEKH